MDKPTSAKRRGSRDESVSEERVKCPMRLNCEGIRDEGEPPDSPPRSTP